MNQKHEDCFYKNTEWFKRRKHRSEVLAKDVGRLSMAIGSSSPLLSCNWGTPLTQGKDVT